MKNIAKTASRQFSVLNNAANKGTRSNAPDHRKNRPFCLKPPFRVCHSTVFMSSFHRFHTLIPPLSYPHSTLFIINSLANFPSFHPFHALPSSILLCSNTQHPDSQRLPKIQCKPLISRVFAHETAFPHSHANLRALEMSFFITTGIICCCFVLSQSQNIASPYSILEGIILHIDKFYVILQ